MQGNSYTEYGCEYYLIKAILCSFGEWSSYSVTCVKAFNKPHQRLRKQDAANFCQFGQSRYFNSYMEVWPKLLDFAEAGAKNWALKSK